jgi:hypothetical protein
MLFEGIAFYQGEAPDEFFGVKDQSIVAVAGGDGEGDVFRRPNLIAPGHIHLGDEYPPLSGVFDLFEPDGPDDGAGIEDGGDADLTEEFSILDDGCHAGSMREQGSGCKGESLWH